ncbi:hypothetical protein ACEWY4_021170 [Coilia grayii]|uniref:G-protein coupled receptors family 1 profile domain-containing protein n=1 Tax=Coilia grayii TaxID=363190 RepID=A0ABD1J8D9_9TELE
MKEPYNQTYNNISETYRENETNCFQDYNFTNSTKLDFEAYFNNISFIVYSVIFFVALPGICFAVYKFCSQEVAPVYVINMFISDLIQISAHPIRSTLWVIGFHDDIVYVMWLIYLLGLQVNIFFMVCISAERYIMIAHAVWYRNIQNISPVAISVFIWILSAVLMVITYFFIDLVIWLMPPVLLLPYPLVMFFFVATWRALSRTSIPRNEQIRIMATLALVLCIYTILFLPYVVVFIYYDIDGVDFVNTTVSYIYLRYSAEMITAFNPLFDLLLYVFMRRDVTDILRAVFCCYKRREGNAGTTHVTDAPV